MLKKLRLIQGDNYSLVLATHHISKMMVNYILGQKHDLEIGSEQGITDWDDFVILKNDYSFEHIQVKRQHKDFSSHNFDKSKSSFKKLSALDKPLKSLADWIKNPPGTNTPAKRFIVEIPGDTALVKDCISIRQFYQFCQQDIGIYSSVPLLQNLINTEKSASNIYTWLTTWCGFNDHQHVLDAMKILELRTTGNENDIENRTIEYLGRCFSNSNSVYLLLKGFIGNNTNFTTSITPRILWENFHSHLLINIPTWTQYYINQSTWEISGINDKNFSNIESPECVVETFWNLNKKCDLRVCNSNQPSANKLPKALIRLAIHLNALAHAYYTDKNTWIEFVKNQTGGTLGISENDFDITSFNIGSESQKNICIPRELATPSLHDLEGDNLSKEMFKSIWKLINKKIFNKIENITDTELKSALTNRWNYWKVELDNNLEKQKNLLRSMMRAEIEKKIDVDLRIGPKTQDLIAQGIFLHLHVSIGFNEDNASWEKVDNDLTIKTCALKYWSDDVNNRVNSIDKKTHELIGRENVDIMILAGTNSPGLINYTMAHTPNERFLTGSRNSPKLLITNSLIINHNDTLADLREFIKTGSSQISNIKEIIIEEMKKL